MNDGRMQHPIETVGLADVLDRVLDKGVVIAGDVAVSLVGVELLNIRLRMLIASVEKAMEMGINWWENDPYLSVGARQSEAQGALLMERVERLEGLLAQTAGQEKE